MISAHLGCPSARRYTSLARFPSPTSGPAPWVSAVRQDGLRAASEQSWRLHHLCVVFHILRVYSCVRETERRRLGVLLISAFVGCLCVSPDGVGPAALASGTTGGILTAQELLISGFRFQAGPQRPLALRDSTWARPAPASGQSSPSVRTWPAPAALGRA